MRLASSALFALLCACGGSPIPSGGEACAVLPSIPSFGAGAGLAATSATRNRIVYQVPMNNETEFDVLAIDLFRGYTAFTDPSEIRTGTFTITEADSRYDTCGVCVLIYANVDRMTFRERQTYMADSGTITITSIDGRISGTLSNVHFRHVNVDDADPDGNGPGAPTFATSEGTPCFTTLGSLAFDTAYPTDAGIPPGLDAL
jgi:hypothetical protein